MATQQYDIFISYRPTGGAQYARILQLRLTQRGYKVFLDYDELTDGVFGDHIKDAIHKAPVFMLVLSAGSMARCVNESDWVRQEIMLALEQGKHIVPVNPDNSFDGFPDDTDGHVFPAVIKEKVGSLQYSEIGFGQTLGITIDLMIKNRLVSTLGTRNVSDHVDADFDAAKESLRKMDAHHKRMRRLGIVGVVGVILIVLATCLLFWRHQLIREQNDIELDALEAMRVSLQEKYVTFGLQLSSGLSMSQMNTIDTLLLNMVPVRPDTLWMSQFEFSVGQWYGIKGEPYDDAQKNMPMSNVSFGEVLLFLSDVGDMTNLNITLPSADEWEYAARGGSFHETTTYVGSNTPDAVAWYKDNANGHAHPSDGQQGKEPNTLDLYDMSGNVSEWCNTPYGENGLYTVCGGNYLSSASEVTTISRKGMDANSKEPTVGFRIVIKKQ